MPSPTPTVAARAGLHSTALDDLGVTYTAEGGRLRIWAAQAERIDLVIFDESDLDWIIDTEPLRSAGAGVWEATTPQLRPGTPYAVRVAGGASAGNAFDSRALLLDPYARGLRSRGVDEWRSVAVAGTFDWGGAHKPRVPLDRTVIYEGHVKGLTKRHPAIPPALHGTYAGLAHPAMVDHLQSLGITSLQLLPVHTFASEPRLHPLGLRNYWGYNTVNFFTPHAAYASERNRRDGPDAVLSEFKAMVRHLHEAGLEVILDVVYNHTSEGGLDGPLSSLRGIDNRSYYRQHGDGGYIDETGCGNAVNTATDAAARLVLDSLRYFANDLQIDGFRFDLAATLGRDAQHRFTPEHPLLRAIIDDPLLADVKKIAEPWDLGMGGWQTGNFGEGWSEWNDRYRDRVRSFWLSDIDHARRTSTAPVGIGGLATRLAGSSNTFSPERGPLASVNFVTAHDGFTLRDLVSFDVAHNLANGEHNRDGAAANRSFNHGAEGPTGDAGILATRRKAMRNLLGTLLFSAGIPMLTAGDEVGRTQHGNNNAYCHDSALTWVPWKHAEWQKDLWAHARRLIALRAENPALRPSRFAVQDERTPSASDMQWYDENGETMSIERWTSPAHRTLQYVAASTPDTEAFNRILLMIHGSETPIDVTLPVVAGAERFVALWSSADERPSDIERIFQPGERVPLPGTSMRLFRAE